MAQKDWRKSLAQSYQWAIAGAVGAAFGGVDLPGPTAFVQDPVVGAIVAGYIIFFLVLIIALGACLDQLVSLVIEPPDASPEN